MTRSRAERMTIQFGKWAGSRLEVIAHRDPHYLRWLCDNVELRGSLRAAVRLLAGEAQG